MKKIVKILLIGIPLLVLIIVISIISMKKKIVDIDEDLLKLDCTGTYYDEVMKEWRPKPIKKDSTLECTLSIHSPKKTKFTYDEISYNYVIEGDYEYVEKPSMNPDLLIYNEKDVHILLTKENTINKKGEYDTIYANLYTFKIHIPNKDNISDKLVFKLSEIIIENNKNIYLLPDYTVSYDIEI